MVMRIAVAASCKSVCLLVLLFDDRRESDRGECCGESLGFKGQWRCSYIGTIDDQHRKEVWKLVPLQSFSVLSQQIFNLQPSGTRGTQTE